MKLTSLGDKLTSYNMAHTGTCSAKRLWVRKEKGSVLTVSWDDTDSLGRCQE
jgi:hypothetical protein